MQNLKKILCFSLVCFYIILFSTTKNVYAEDSGNNNNNPITRPWNLSASLGFVKNSGDTVASDFNGQTSGDYTRGNFKQLGSVKAQYSSSDGETSNKRYIIETQSRFDLTTRDYFFSGTRYDRNFLGSYAYVLTVAAGYGRYIIRNNIIELDAELGPGYRWQRPQDELQDREIIAQFQESFSWNISNDVSFNENLLIQYGEDNTFTQLDLNLKSTIIGHLASQIGFTAEYNTTIPADASKKYQLITSVNLVYTF